MTLFKKKKETPEEHFNSNHAEMVKTEGAAYYEVRGKDGRVKSSEYAENSRFFEDENLSEMINVRFSKKTVADIKRIIDERYQGLGVASIIRMWVLARLNEERNK